MPDFRSQISVDPEVTFEEPDSSAPTDTTSILAKFGAQLGYPEEPSDVGEPEQTHPTSAEPAWLAKRREGEPESGGERSIEDYMADLIQRVGGSVASFAQSAREPRPPKKPMPAVSRPSDAVEESAPEPPIEDFRPRVKQPTMNLSAMRDVANQTARVALDRHAHRQRIQDAYLKWSIAASSLILGTGLSYWAKSPKSMTAVGAGAAFLATLYCTVQGAICWRAGMRDRRDERARDAEPTNLPPQTKSSDQSA